jgi:topoisomerase-4 subunit A
LAQIERRLEILSGFLIVFLNLDDVIQIVREEDDPKGELIRRFELNAVQADSILNMRLRQLRKLEEIEIRKEYDLLAAEQADIANILGSEPRRWKLIAEDIAAVSKAFGANTRLGRRRTTISDAPEVPLSSLEAMVEREPITVLCSEKGWLRAVKGHIEDTSEIRYKEGDRGRFVVHAHTTDKLIVLATDGRFYTLACDRLPGGRGQGEPLRLMIDLGDEQEPVAMLVHQPDRRLIVASSQGRGFLIKEAEVIAQTRSGKQVLNVITDEQAAACVVVPPDADAIAIVGTNRRMLIVALDEIPSMTRGRGVILQRYREGRLADILAFTLADGLSWRAGSGTRTEVNLGPWIGKRGQTGQKVPRGFPASGHFL